MGLRGLLNLVARGVRLLKPGAGRKAQPLCDADLLDPSAWACRPGVVVRGLEEAERGRCLHVTGTQAGAWSFMTAGRFAPRPGAAYRIGAALKVAACEPPHAPHLRIAFLGGPRGRASMGSVSLPAYQLDRGDWQDVGGEFAVPAGAGGVWIAFAKGAPEAVSVDALLAGLQVEQIPGLTALEQWDACDLPPGPPAADAGRPRMHMTAERLRLLRERAGSDPTYASLVDGVLQVADRGVRTGPPAGPAQGESDDGGQHWQMATGEMVPDLALAWLLTRKAPYLAAAKDFMLASCGYETWGRGGARGVDLAAGHQLYGMAVAYDWLHGDLDEATRGTVRDCLAERGGRMFEAAATGQIWWHDKYLQNHLWVNVAGLAAAGLALRGEVDGVDRWLALALERYRAVMEALGPDGALHEGVPYWSYGTEYLLKFMDLACDLLGEDMFAGNDWFANAAWFRLYSSLPRDSWRAGEDGQSLMSFADGGRRDTYGPDYQLRRLAGRYGLGHAQWLADALDEAGLCECQARFLNPLWYDPAVSPEPPDTLPTFRHFGDLDLVVMRSGWSGDEAVCAFKCGPHIGHHALARFSEGAGGGHAHPDAGALQIFACGDWLLVDDGYAFKATQTQNTVLVNGVGQAGDGAGWFRGGPLCVEKRGARVLAAVPGARLDYVIGDATEAYRREAGLRRFLRHVYYLKPSCWVVVDELAAERPSIFEAFFHSDYPFERAGNGSCVTRGPSGQLAATVLRPEGAQCDAFPQEVRGIPGHVPTRSFHALKVSNPEPAAASLGIYVLRAGPVAGPAVPGPALREEEGGLRLHVPTPECGWVFELLPERPDPASPIIRRLDAD